VGAAGSAIPSTAWSLARGDDLLDGARAAGAIVLPHERRTAVLLLAASPVHLALSLGWAAVLAAKLPHRAGVGRCRRAGDRRPRSVADRTAHLVDPGTSARPAVGRSRGIRPRCWAGAAETEVGWQAPNPTEVNAEASTANGTVHVRTPRDGERICRGRQRETPTRRRCCPPTSAAARPTMERSPSVDCSLSSNATVALRTFSAVAARRKESRLGSEVPLHARQTHGRQRDRLMQRWGSGRART
jgi:hypothetical protein